jgi:hypothetical protein
MIGGTEMKASSVALPVVFVAIAVAIPLQHCASLRAHEKDIQRPYRILLPGQGSVSSPIRSEYPDGTQREFTYKSGILAESRLIKMSTGETLEETSYHSEMINGRVLPVITKRKDYTLWGRTKWYALGIAVVCVVLSLIMLRAEQKRGPQPNGQ